MRRVWQRGVLGRVDDGDGIAGRREEAVGINGVGQPRRVRLGLSHPRSGSGRHRRGRPPLTWTLPAMTTATPADGQARSTPASRAPWSSVPFPVTMDGVWTVEVKLGMSGMLGLGAARQRWILECRLELGSAMHCRAKWLPPKQLRQRGSFQQRATWRSDKAPEPFATEQLLILRREHPGDPALGCVCLGRACRVNALAERGWLATCVPHFIFTTCQNCERSSPSCISPSRKRPACLSS
jgi:hypothetical protein